MLSSFKELAYLRIPLEDIRSATNNFDPTNLTRKSDFQIYKGVLSRSGEEINVDVQTLHDIYPTEVELLKAVSLLSCLEHKNIATFVGFCQGYKVSYFVTKQAVNGSLDQHLTDQNLTCFQRLQICLGTARALSYIHYDLDDINVHGDIRSSKILLDEDWKAKVVGFGSVLNPENNTCYHQKSDVYSFGLVLIEVFCPQYARSLHKGGCKIRRISYRDFDYNLGTQMNSRVLLYLSEKLINNCLKEQHEQRPDMDEIVKELDKALLLQWKHENLESIKIGLDNIKLATENFAETYLIGSGGYGKVYKAELDIFYAESFSEIEGKNRDEMPKKCTTVAIKHILNDEKGQGKQGFFLEIETLRRCLHRSNIVSLLGYCDEHSELILVYEHVRNGSLDDYLGSIEKATYLTWVQRLQISLDIAHGLDYLHTNMKDKKKIIHRDIKSANILLGKNWEAKIADFGLSKFYPANHLGSTIFTNNIAGTEVYLDPEYLRTGKLKKQSDIYSFGVVLFEILSGRLAYDKIYLAENIKGLAAVARKRFKEGTLTEIVDPKVMEEVEELLGLKIGPTQESLETFSKIAFQCLAKTQEKRPTMKVIIKELQNALNLQEKRKDIFKFALEDIKLGTENFSHKNFIRREGFGKLYRGEVPYDNGRKTVVLKVSRSSEEHNFLRELEILFGHKHENVIGFVGYCKEMDEKIIVYENVSNGCTLSSYVNEASLTWTKRLEICIGVANGLKFLHEGFARQQVIVHRDIKSANIILNEDWNAKICGFEFSLISPKNQEMEYVINDVVGSPGYCDPVYWETGFLTKESDIYSFGVVLFEMLCGRLACPKDFRESSQFLDSLINNQRRVGRLDEIVFEGIKGQIALKSLATFRRIAYQCLHEEREKRPTADEVAVQLKKALEFQVIWDRPSRVIASRSGKDRLLVKMDLYSLKLKEGNDLSAHIDSFNQLVCELSNIDEIIKEDELALLMLSSLPKSYKRFVDNMLTGMTTLTLKDVFQKLSDNK